MSTPTNTPDQHEPLSQALSRALSAVPVPIRLKEQTSTDGGKTVVVRERILIKDISFKSLMNEMCSERLNCGLCTNQLKAALSILNVFGVVGLDKMPIDSSESWEKVRISATSERAGYLLQSLGKQLIESPYSIMPIPTSIRVERFHSVLESALERNQLPPHLLMAIFLELGRNDAEVDPIRGVRVISVLIKGKRTHNKLPEGSEEVYLHVKKPGWKGFSLIGSTQMEGMNDEQTARLALNSRLKSTAAIFELEPSGVNDVEVVELSMTTGAYTIYSFNLYIAQSLNSTLLFSDDIKYGWFTYEEILKQRSRENQRILTRPELIKSLNDQGILQRVPVTVDDPDPYKHKSFKAQFYDIGKETRDTVLEIGQLAGLIWERVIVARWWLVVAIIMVFLILLLRPYLSRSYPILSTVADILGILGFLGTLLGVFNEIRKQRDSAGS